MDPRIYAPKVYAAANAECRDSEALKVFVSPERPSAGAPLRVMAVAEEATGAHLLVRAPDEAEPLEATVTARGGPPYSYYAEVPAAQAGTYRIVVHRGEELLACRDVDVAPSPQKVRTYKFQGAWAIERPWSQSFENLYSAWIEMLFDAPLEEQPSWAALHFVTRDRTKNFLHNYLGMSEDEPAPKGLTLEPDCADLPYFLRAYFAFKHGLPYAYSSCSRGGGGRPPTCMRSFHNLEPVESKSGHPVRVFDTFLRVDLQNKVHSGNGRTQAESDETDLYPVPLSADSIRPGRVYADPYGHLLVVTKRIAQTEENAGVLLAVDGQPDGTVARRRYWRGNFLYALGQPELGSPGFKRFRPTVVEGGAIRSLKNDEIASREDYSDYSLEQYELGVEGFYDRMDDVLSPAPLDPEQALLEVVIALEEQMRGRVLSVQNGVKYTSEHGGTIDMPDGPAIFETTGPWEDFSTPSRDLRLLIAIDVVRGFPDRVARRPDRFAMPKGQPAADVVASMRALLEKETKKRTITYQRSDGSDFTLSMADVISRATDLEMAYNPNDCVEIRWAAPEGSAERATCRRHAPPGQRRDMDEHRPWFAERRRPVRR